MTREEAIRIIKIVLVVAKKFEITVQGEEFTEEKCKEAVEIATEALSSSENPNKWIPVSERLPEIHNYMQEYIVTIKGNFIRTAFFTETNGKSWWSIDNVTAWMPLPLPWKGE